mmetsp:Transcript_62968/g.182615  ORF Transcript_62968/g.182615 Transcript_62968/m.182615 type:complete len:86 (-) Transcript_62968:203-460(-)
MPTTTGEGGSEQGPDVGAAGDEFEFRKSDCGLLEGGDIAGADVVPKSTLHSPQVAGHWARISGPWTGWSHMLPKTSHEHGSGVHL